MEPLLTKEDVYQKVVNDYISDDVELNIEHFDFDVNMPVRDLMEVYREIQMSVNGDYVTCLTNVTTQKNPDDKTETIITGTEAPSIDENLCERYYDGNFKTLLRLFAENCDQTGIYRIMDMRDLPDGRITGVELALAI